MPEHAVTDPAWPKALRDYLRTTYSATPEVTPLHGVGVSTVFRLDFPDLSLVLKVAQPSEAIVYQHFAEPLRASDIPLPALTFATLGAKRWWLLLEHIPQPLPRSRWQGDPECLAVLSRLHRAALEVPAGPYYAPRWTDAIHQESADALRTLLPDARLPLAALEKAREASRAMLHPTSWIAGDPNPTNWGLREDGGLVLYDWERFGRGPPALDIAVSLAGFGTLEQYEWAADMYLSIADLPRADASSFANDLILAKAFTIAEFLSSYVRGGVRDAAQTARLARALPAWCETMILERSFP